MLATLPTFKVKKYASEDNPELYFAPQQAIPLEDPTNDLQEMIIKDNVQGALQQLQLLKGYFQQADAIFPTTMGALPSSNTTATAVAGADARSNARALFKSLTFEHTCLNELSWALAQVFLPLPICL